MITWSKAVRVLSQALLILGIVLLSVFAVAHIHRLLGSGADRAISQMRFTEAMRAVEQSVRTELNDSYVPGAGFHVNGKRNASDAQPLGARRMPPVAGQPRP